MSVLPECTHVYHRCAWCPRGSEEDINLGLEQQMVLSHHGDAEIEPGSCEEPHMVLTSKPSLQHLYL